MEKRKNSAFIKKTGQEMYFDEKIAKIMMEREENVEHILTSKIIEAILIAEFGDRENLKIADLGAGAHPQRYKNFLQFLKQNKGRIFWADQSRIMLDFAKQKTPEEFQEIFEYVEEEMTHYLGRKEGEFDGLVFKYSFNYLTPCSFREWMKVIYQALKKSGKVIANLNLYEKGMKKRSYNAIYTIKGKKVKQGYKPKHGEVIEVHFLKMPGDQSSDPKTFASTKIIYHTSEAIKEAAKEAGFHRVEMLEDWQQRSEWKKIFARFNPDLKPKQKSILFLEK